MSRSSFCVPGGTAAAAPCSPFYFGVSSMAAAKEAIESSGGKLLNGPHEVSGGQWIIIATDPHGAVFGVVGPKGI